MLHDHVIYFLSALKSPKATGESPKPSPTLMTNNPDEHGLDNAETMETKPRIISISQDHVSMDVEKYMKMALDKV
jgi:hypothetical protein